MKKLGALCKAVTLPLGHLSSPNICTNNGARQSVIDRTTTLTRDARTICQSHSANHKAEEGTKQKKEEIHR